MLNSSKLETNRDRNARPFFSICIPQYNRTDFLIKACSTYASQTFRDFEICISDDCSTDGKESALLDYLRGSNLVFTYARTASNLRYDGNLRNAIALSSGQYLVLMGNDDGFSNADVLQGIHDDLARFAPVAVAITNYRELGSGRVFRRMTETGVLGQGRAAAVSLFRRYSFVGGVVLQGQPSRDSATDAVDGTEMYQMYLGARLVGCGGRFLAIDRICVDKDLQIAGQVVDSYSRKPRLDPCPIVERPLPMGRLLEVVARGLDGCDGGLPREVDLVAVAMQLYRFTYPYWIVEYRRVQSWRYALGVFLAVRPTRIARELRLSRLARARLWMIYSGMGAVALTIPISFFDGIRPQLYALAKRYRPS